jgi:hypothetical protein
VIVVYCQRSLQRDDHSLKGVLPSVVFLSVIAWRPWPTGGLSIHGKEVCGCPTVSLWSLSLQQGRWLLWCITDVQGHYFTWHLSVVTAVGSFIVLRSLYVRYKRLEVKNDSFSDKIRPLRYMDTSVPVASKCTTLIQMKANCQSQDTYTTLCWLINKFCT